ncbi:MAG: Type 1 glutamine amidotransferase-like domain-containing protein [Oscillospiraceae bacterium]|nr:Type 1 glutamine amidotransferase-like domain-containing protein [Oscillospiraceae bacterium]
MKTHYYFDWFYDGGFSEKLIKMLNKDITNRKSLVMISAARFEDKTEQICVDDFSELAWLNQAGIIFEEYHLINHLTEKEEAQRLVQHASVIFLCGGNYWYQKHLLNEYELSGLIKNSSAIVMGTSAGGMNMSDKWVGLKPLGDNKYERAVFNGIALNHFSFEAHFDIENKALVEGHFPLSEIMDIYVAANQDGAVRVNDDKIDIIGNVYLISKSKILKLDETL